MQRLRAVRWSVLDRALMHRGQHPSEALRASVQFAQHIEELGYHRFWLAEHHGVPGVAGSAPTVLAAAVAAATTHIRVGTGGVMLPNHAPLVVAEQFGVLESLHPGRIDMGVGRSVGFTDGVRRALGVGKDAGDQFDAQLTELLGYFADVPGMVRAQPARGLRVPAFVLALGESADFAAAHGLPLVLAYHRDEDRLQSTLERYRSAFRSSSQGAQPYVMLAVNVGVAATAEAAAALQAPEAWASVYSRTRGDFPPLEPPQEVLAREMTERERDSFAHARAGQLHGDEPGVATVLARLLDRTGADEVLVTLAAHGTRERLDSYRRLASLAGLSGTKPLNRSTAV